MAEHNELGKKGEKLAIEYLIKSGYTILTKNYFFQKAEVDIIAKKDNILAVIEVKTRSSTYFGNPEEFVDNKKIKLLVSAIDNFINENDLNVDVRFDIIAITKQQNSFEIKHLKDAFLFL
ncbi:MAG: YraN family protein [Tenacibaculum sp.]|nr:YraN family protein [Tenacibaculum sp.]